jgi:hypothetical protein
MATPFIELTAENTHVPVKGELRAFRIELELTLRQAAAALGLDVVKCGELERGLIHLKDEQQWQKTKALLREASGCVPTSTATRLSE